ncbi:unnamed protein product [Lepeophtheirus salmonis]|uniref:(salmon louse) hypothetical protein n=1 Tax=Lepeophtheirus salmonis TaxID=72036 RepID=A0A7R8CVQ0_LEPSM|nr:unnamed protein product [Lepeophtheirus salmonis]CAF2945194.1 unnamed protein product [Lepeophtheirus salmonis]
MFQSLLIDNVEELIGNYEHHSLEESLKNLTEFASKLESPEEKWNFYLEESQVSVCSPHANWAGYTLKDENLANMSHITPCINEILDTEGEGLYPVIRHPELLTLARLLLMDGSSVIEEDAWFLDFWKLRCVSVHQECLLETSERLRTAGDEFISKIKKNVSHIENLTIRALFYLEATCFYSKYRELVKMQEHFKIATDIIGIEIEALGALGKRTKFQQNDLAQYTLDIKRKDSARNGHYNDVDEKVSDLPRDIKLDDELRLNKIKFKEEREDLNLTKIERAALITAFGVVLMSQPKDSLTLEETIPYINAILFNNDTWSLQNVCFVSSESLPTKDERDAYNRLNMVFVSQSLPFWKLEGSLVRLYLVLGSTKSALDLALRLELWEDVINCYHLLQLRHKAAEVIQSQLSIKETPLLWCMMGDATDDLSCYEKALEMKDGKFSRALRSLGLGFAATECEEWELAASVYRSYCIFETDNFEAWNNLANAYIKMGQKSRAWKVLQEAVKCDYENWKIWENIMTVSTDCAHFEEVIKAYNRILDLKEGKFIDTEVLEILVKAIVNDIPDSYNRPTAKNFRKPALKLFGRLSSTVLDNSDLSLQLLSNPKWEMDIKNVKSLLCLGHELVQGAIKSSHSSANQLQTRQLMSSIRMTLRGLLAKIEKIHLDINNK